MHKHITLQEISGLIGEKGDAEKLHEIRDCPVCRERLKKAESLLKGLQKKAFSESEALYNQILSETGTDEDFFSFIEQAPLARASAKKKGNIPALKPVVWGIAGLAAACLVLAINFFYDALLPAGDFIALSPSVSDELKVSRSGLFFGTRNITADRILINRDRLHARKDLFLDTSRGMGLHVDHKSSFSFMKTENIFAADLKQGRFYIIFKKSAAGLEVRLPGDCTIAITGTEIYFDVEREQRRVYVSKGRARLIAPDRPVRELKRDLLYSIDDEGRAKGRSPGKGDVEKRLRVFDTLREDVDVTSAHGAKKAGSFKKTSVITTKKGKKYIGSFQVMGKKVKVITEEGTFMIPSEEIRSLEPHRK